MTLHITDQVLMSEWKNILFLVDFLVREQLVFLNTLELPCGPTTSTCVKYRLMKGLMKTPKMPSSTALKQLPISDKNNSILSSVQHHSLNSASSTQHFSCSFHVPSLCKGQRKQITSCLLPDTPVWPIFCLTEIYIEIYAKIWLLQNLLKLCKSQHGNGVFQYSQSSNSQLQSNS